MPAERILFVTGRLAEASLRELLATLAPKSGFEYDVAVLGISVAALMSVDFVARKLDAPSSVDRVLLSGMQPRSTTSAPSRRYFSACASNS